MDRIITGGQVLNLVERKAVGVHEVWLVSPFLSAGTIADLISALSQKSSINLKVITKWEPIDLLLGYSDIDAFAQLFKKSEYKKWNVQVFIAQQLHAKVILLGKSLGIVGSMNLTRGGFAMNLELGAAFEKNDSKLTTLNHRIEEIAHRSYELTAAAYKWKLENELPRYEAKAEQLKKLRELLEHERNEGLQSFVFGNDGDEASSYFRGVVDFLQYIGSKRVSRAQVLDWLDSNSQYGGGNINNARLELLERLGLVYEGPEGISQTPLGQDIAADRDEEAFAQLLFGMYPEFQRLLEELSDKPQHPEELSSRLERGGVDYWALRLRWLVSLGYAEPVLEGVKKFYRRIGKVS